jgi:hypothetical protein
MKLSSLLAKRLKENFEKPSKTAHLAELSSKGELSSISGVFGSIPLSLQEQEKLQLILTEFAPEEYDIAQDLEQLMSISSEVKAIHHQAALLHGERIKKAQEVLKKYRDGAFSSWLIGVYGNRQTPYNFLHYFELYQSLSAALKEKMDQMPRQAVYSLAARNGEREKKEEIIQNYQGQTKQELLLLIRETFPLAKDDRRNQNLSRFAINQLTRLHLLIKSRRFNPSPDQKKEIKRLLKLLDAEV